VIPQSRAQAGRSLLPALAGMALASAGLVMAFNYFVVRTSSILSVWDLRYDLVGLEPQGPGGWTDDWLWHQGAPFKYRLLGKLPIWAVDQGLQQLGVKGDLAFYYGFVAALLACLFLALLTLGALTRALAEEAWGPQPRGAQLSVAAIAMALFALSPPILFFCKHPVHGSANDVLGYFLMAAVLLLALRQRLAAASAVAVLAVFCRETTLLAPFALLFFAHVPLRRRLAAALPPVAVFLAYRALWPGSYDAAGAASANFERPLETLGFAMLVFGPVWIFGVLGCRYLAGRGALAPGLRGLLRSFPWAVALTLCVTLLFARLREIRIAYILCVYFVPFAALWLHRFGGRLAALARSRGALLWAATVLVAMFRLRVWLLPVSKAQRYRLESELGAVFLGYAQWPQYNWVLTTVVYLGLFLLALPLLARRWTDGETATQP